MYVPLITEQQFHFPARQIGALERGPAAVFN